MLEFIVLGQVPGTHIQLSFFGVVGLWLTFIVLVGTAIKVLSVRSAIKQDLDTTVLQLLTTTKL